MRRIPVLPTLIVAAAVAIMVALGIWQIGRAAEKDALVAELAGARERPPVAWPARPDPQALPLFRRASLICRSVEGWRAASGRSTGGEPGWAHIATCRIGDGAVPAQVVVGWSRTVDEPAWTGGLVSGTVAPDSRALIRLVADRAPAGFAPAGPPGPDEIPNNHMAYAVQWFLFALSALAVYALALRRRTRR